MHYQEAIFLSSTLLDPIDKFMLVFCYLWVVAQGRFYFSFIRPYISMSFSAGIALALATVLSGNPSAAAAINQPMPQAQSVHQYVENYFADEPIMIKVAECESHFQQYSADGSVYHGKVDPDDIGVMQINQHYQGATAKQLGIDINTIEGNVAYAQYLYQKEGTQPWSSSKPCWGKTAQVLADASK